jgi:hypothetical protein
MNRKTLLVAGTAAATLSALLAACGGGATSSASSSGSSSGVLTAFGSVFVNGTEYATSGSTSVVDGDADDAPSATTALQVGMHVDVDASSGAASLLRYRSAVRGEVDAVDATNNTLTVLGQTVLVSSATSYSGNAGNTGTTAVTGLSNISAGDYVVVHGFQTCTNGTTASGDCTGGATQIAASLVAEPATLGAYRVEGYAEGATASGFTVNGLKVSLGTSTSCTPTPCAVSTGQFVEVRSATAPVASGTAPNTVLTLAATRVKALQQAPVLTPGTTVTLEGPAVNISTTANTFKLRGVVVDGSGVATSVAALVAGQVVEVTGTVSSSGTLVASAVVVERAATFAFLAPLSAESTSSLTVLGQAFSVSTSTKFVDRVSNARPFNSTNFSTVLAAGDEVIVSGYTDANGHDVATRVERVPAPPAGLEGVEGLVSADSTNAGTTPGSVTAGTVSIGGVTVAVGSTTALGYPGAAASPTLASFFTAITPNTSVVIAAGASVTATPGTVNATRAVVLGANGARGWAGHGAH